MDRRGPIPNDSDSSAGRVEGRLPTLWMYQFAIELFNTGELWPRPFIEVPSCFDEDIAVLNEFLAPSKVRAFAARRL